jgi:hypothetical protein
MPNFHETRVFGLGWVRDGIARFVSRITGSWVWYDTHLPLVLQPAHVERPSLPGHRSITEVHRGGRR